jgi:hypothetical protein
MTGPERRVDGFFTICERITLRVLIFCCFALEVWRFAHWLWMSSPH